MIKINNLTIPVNVNENGLKKIIADKLKTRVDNIERIDTLKKSMDARKKDSIKFVLSVAIKLKDERGAIKLPFVEKYEPVDYGIENLPITKLSIDGKVVVIGSGPAGLFSALTLLERGVKPIIIERGYEVERREQAVNELQTSGVLSTISNIQFGEGGAGTFSDGKLNTGTKSPFISTVLHEFVKYGANADIEYINKPHIGTDVLRRVVVNMRNDIIARGGQFMFGTKVDDIVIKDNRVQAVRFSGEHNGEIETHHVMLAIGHSARDTFEMLNAKKVIMEQKAFSIGVRIEHEQSLINKSQYGVASSPFLPTADYKLATHMENGRGVYTFCMCPGGEVVCGSSEEGGVVTNGMSYRARDGRNANSALLVGITPADFGSDNVLAGVEFQRKYEGLAYKVSNSYKAPIQKLGDLRANKVTSTFGSVKPTYEPGTVMADLRAVLPSYCIEGILFGTEQFDRKIKGFNGKDALLTGVESRSSSPVRIVRNEKMTSSVAGLYPVGEGAGYAGGITSSAVDGIKVAMAVEN